MLGDHKGGLHLVELRFAFLMVLVVAGAVALTMLLGSLIPVYTLFGTALLVALYGGIRGYREDRSRRSETASNRARLLTFLEQGEGFRELIDLRAMCVGDLEAEVLRHWPDTPERRDPFLKVVMRHVNGSPACLDAFLPYMPQNLSVASSLLEWYGTCATSPEEVRRGVHRFLEKDSPVGVGAVLTSLLRRVPSQPRAPWIEALREDRELLEKHRGEIDEYQRKTLDRYIEAWDKS